MRDDPCSICHVAGGQHGAVGRAGYVRPCPHAPASPPPAATASAACGCEVHGPGSDGCEFTRADELRVQLIESQDAVAALRAEVATVRSSYQDEVARLTAALAALRERHHRDWHALLLLIAEVCGCPGHPSRTTAVQPADSAADATAPRPAGLLKTEGETAVAPQERETP